MNLDRLWDWLKNDRIYIKEFLGSIAILIVAFMTIAYIMRFLRQFLLKHRARFKLSFEMTYFILRVLRVALWVGVGFLILSFWGVGVSGLWTSLVSVTAVIGVGFLAVWTMISNVTANLLLTIWNPFHMGMDIEILPENYKGKVVERNMMFTVLREKEGSTVYIPNNMFFQKMFRAYEAKQQHFFETFENETETS